MSVTVTVKTTPTPRGSPESTLDVAMADWAEELTKQINDPWPEKTGRSRWFVSKDGPARYSVGSAARYAPFVHLKGERIPFVQSHAPAIVARVGAETATEIAEAMAPHVAAAVTS